MNNSTNKTFRYLLNSNVDDYLTPTPSIASTLNLETLSLNKPFFISGSMKVQILHDYNQTLKEEEAAKDDYDELSRKEFLPDESLNLFLRLSRLNSTFTKQPIINSQLPDLEPHPSELDYETLVEPQTHPDGTTQGMSCIAVFLVMVARWGSSGAFGVYIDYYLSHSSFAGATSLQFAYLRNRLASGHTQQTDHWLWRINHFSSAVTAGHSMTVSITGVSATASECSTSETPTAASSSSTLAASKVPRLLMFKTGRSNLTPLLLVHWNKTALPFADNGTTTLTTKMIKVIQYNTQATLLKAMTALAVLHGLELKLIV
ncbi:hypothetical protein WICPIJ_010158 [Wickerhamomyces pijperi]|uniref:Uncharacterized protein n=1 Tax=Wickerhamomyces pijperi TaxID=599730 RepID=A0A9P8PIS3_WICPI|nr:hypothetical protein WICPIJ_010158 [Wickerhamomyces pijperi]